MTRREFIALLGGAASGHATTAPPMTDMNSRLFTR